ncbi:hypothetical protein AMELA_G00207920 [Ameiurus melas]|uniref:Uncharacterized protein n=1 Tax=Ameiurus melas TaxID=219545 RepID=A0A7J6A610_AMEME|nr:hypothetical protein AMELA_G00207920 [Ameiurus melas]
MSLEHYLIFLRGSTSLQFLIDVFYGRCSSQTATAHIDCAVKRQLVASISYNAALRKPAASRPPAAGGLQSGSKMKMGPGRRHDFSPLPWSQYFETMEDVEVDNDNSKDISFI